MVIQQYFTVFASVQNSVSNQPHWPRVLGRDCPVMELLLRICLCWIICSYTATAKLFLNANSILLLEWTKMFQSTRQACTSCWSYGDTHSKKLN